ILLAQKARRLSSSTSLVGWLYMTARHCSRNARRASLRRARHETEAAKQRPEIMDMPSSEPSSSAQQVEVEQAVHDAMSRLDAMQRDLLLMRFFQRMTLCQVGQAIGVSEDAAR